MPASWPAFDDPNAQLLASVLPPRPVPLTTRVRQRIERAWAGRSRETLSSLTSRQPWLRWAFVGIATFGPVLGLYQRVASSAASRATQALTPARAGTSAALASSLPPRPAATRPAAAQPRAAAAQPQPAATEAAAPEARAAISARPTGDGLAPGSEASAIAPEPSLGARRSQPADGGEVLVPRQKHAKAKTKKKKSKHHVARRAAKAAAHRHRARPAAE